MCHEWNRARPTCNGPLFDSRRGLGAYYRYKPRHVASLCDDRDNGVRIAEPKIHRGRVRADRGEYHRLRPAGLPQSYRLVDAGTGRSSIRTHTNRRAERQRARGAPRACPDHIFWRRVLYYMFVFATLGLVFMPYYRPPIRGAEPEGWLETLLSWGFGSMSAFLPGPLGSWASYWTDAWVQSAAWFLILVVFYGWLLWHSRGDRRQHPSAERGRLVAREAMPRGRSRAIPGIGIFEKVARRWRAPPGCSASAG